MEIKLKLYDIRLTNKNGNNEKVKMKRPYNYIKNTFYIVILKFVILVLSNGIIERFNQFCAGFLLVRFSRGRITDGNNGKVRKEGLFDR